MSFRLAAQHQSKAGDQWTFFQAKRIRGTTLETTAELLQSLGSPAPFAPNEIDSLLFRMVEATENAPTKKSTADDVSPATMAKATAAIKAARVQLSTLLKDDAVRASQPFLTSSTVPTVNSPSQPISAAPEQINAAIDAIRQRKTEVDTADLIRNIKPNDIDTDIRQAEANADAFDKACAPVNDTIRKFRSLFANLSAAVPSFTPNQRADRPDFGAADFA